MVLTSKEEMKQPISEVYNEDCMVGMGRYPDKWFDLAVVDPPYGIGEDGRKRDTRLVPSAKWKTPKANPYHVAEWDNNRPDAKYFAELRRVSKNQIIWGYNHFSDYLPPTTCVIVWDKEVSGDFSDCELAYGSFDKAIRKFTWLWDGFKKKVPEHRIHPTQKPIALYKWLLTNYAKPGDRILDTHLGSGSSRIAAWDMGFDFYGWELDVDYFAAMQKRFEAHISKPVLFAPDQMYRFEQAKMFED